MIPKAQPGSIAWEVQRQYGAWFDRLQALTAETLNPDHWTGRWYDGLSPIEALHAGRDEDWREWETQTAQ